MKRNIKEIIDSMTLEEKAGMCSGADAWHLKSVERLGIPSVAVSDGPHGLRKIEPGSQNDESIKAVCFPTACATACSFDRDLIRNMGEALGEECCAVNVYTLLGPAVNIKRSPLCGRNFEYFSEDPYLASQMASNFIKGVQSKNVGTSIKHFACNSQEYRRMSCSSEVDERTLREIYLAAFETAIKEGIPETVMSSYNRINGEFASESRKLLTDILRNEWKYDGYVMSDWGAVNDRVKALEAGLDLEMPGSGGIMDAQIVKAVKSGELDEAVLDKTVERILRSIFKYEENKQSGRFDFEADHKKACEVAKESMVLLKNEGVLPLRTDEKIAFIGYFAEKPRFQGGGSSHINSFKCVGALESSKKYADVSYARGYDIKEDIIDEKLVEEAVRKAEEADVAVIFAGLPDSFESEGYDRSDMKMPICQNYLIDRIAKVQKNVVVVLHNGSPVEMPWADKVKGILESYLCGQAVGEAQCEILFGKFNPCGKLAETIPYKLSDNPSYINFPGDGITVDYSEGIFVGYRYYDKKEMGVRFPFGYGLSYTTFEYSDLRLSKKKMKDNDELTVSVKVKNTGSMSGKEIVELYVSEKNPKVSKAVRELKNFEKIYLEPGEEKTVTMILDKRSFAYYCTKISDWTVSSGVYEIQVGKSSRDICLSDEVVIESTSLIPYKVHRNTTVAELEEYPKAVEIIKKYVARLTKSVGQNDTEADRVAKAAVSDEMIIQQSYGTPLRAFRSFIGLSNEELDKLIVELQDAVDSYFKK